MIEGIGIDIVEIGRFKKIKYNSKPSFYKKLFRENEINYCLKFKNSYEHFAGKFALKESVKKRLPDEGWILFISAKPSIVNRTFNQIFFDLKNILKINGVLS